MKLLRYFKKDKTYVGLLIEEGIIDLVRGAEAYKASHDKSFFIPRDMMGWIETYSNLYLTLDTLLKVLRKHNRIQGLIEEDIQILAPIDTPSKIMCLGLNYSEHASETGFEVPEEPVLFVKVPTTINDPEGDVLCAKKLGRIDPEAELAVIISKKAKDVKKEDAFDYVLGYTVLNDVTARDMQSKDIHTKNPWFRSKNIDGFCPIGPHIAFKEAVSDPHQLNIQLKVNGEVRQNDNTRNLIFKIPEMIAYITSMVTLNPGDIIATGTPSGIQAVQNGDVMEVSIEGIGLLRNTIKEI